MLVDRPSAPARERRVEQRGHPLALGFRRRALPRVVAHHERSQAEVPDVPADVHGRRPPVDLAPVLGPRLPAPRHLLLEGDEREVLEEAEEVDDRVALRARERRDRNAAVAEHDRRRAVGGQGIEVGVPPHRAVDVGVGLDDPGRDVRAGGVDLGLAVRRQVGADLGDAPVADPDVGPAYAAAPVPSTTVPPRMSRSGMRCSVPRPDGLRHDRPIVGPPRWRGTRRGRDGEAAGDGRGRRRRARARAGRPLARLPRGRPTATGRSGSATDDAGLEYLEIDGAPFERLSPGGIAMLGAMGDETARPGPDRRYMDVMPFGACDPGDRIEWLDKEQLDAVVLYPTIGIIWECGRRRRRAVGRLHARLQPLDRRLLPRLRRPPRPGRAPQPLRPGRARHASSSGRWPTAAAARSSPRSRGRASAHGHPDHDVAVGDGRTARCTRSASTRATSPTSRTR